MYKKDEGFTLVELIVAIALIGVIGTMVFTLVGAGRNQTRIARENFDAQSEARIAMAYITTTIRQNDINGGVSVLGSALVIRNSSGALYQVISFNNANKNLWVRDVVLNSTKVIANINGVTFRQDGNRIDITIGYGNDKELKSTITLRSE